MSTEVKARRRSERPKESRPGDDIEQGLRFRIERTGARAEVLEVDAPRALLGSGAHCEVRLSPHEAAPEQLLVRCSPQGLDAVCCGAPAATLLDGAPFVRGAIPDGARFSIGDCHVRIERIGVLGGHSRASAQRAGRLPLLVLGLASLATLVVLLVDPAADGSVAPPPRTPALWEPADAQSCARSARDEARELGQIHWQAALMKRERAPYYLEDAMTAVGLFQRAQACFELGRDTAAADRAGREFERLLLQLEADYHRRRVLLERAIGQSDWRAAAREAHALQRLLGERHPDYAGWLGDVERFAAAWTAPDQS
ncbi:MAG TPA: hypothetical protein VMG12_45065 [Polyangiaceae bacterium]|nr:hypothetical protein [Polyangiaceae bacterium]